MEWLDSYDSNTYALNLLTGRIPRIVAYNVDVVDPTSVLNCNLMEAVHGGTTGTVAAGLSSMLTLGTSATINTSMCLQPLVAETDTLMVDGPGAGATTRNTNTIVPFQTWRTGSSLDSDARNISFYATITMPVVDTVEVMVGFHGPDFSKIGCGATAATLGYTVPDDGFYFFYNPAITGAYWAYCVNYSTPIDSIYNSGIAVVANRRYALMARLGTGNIPYFYINGQLVGTGNAVDQNTALAPIASVTTRTGAIRYLHLKNFWISRTWRDE